MTQRPKKKPVRYFLLASFACVSEAEATQRLRNLLFTDFLQVKCNFDAGFWNFFRPFLVFCVELEGRLDRVAKIICKMSHTPARR